MHLKKLKKLVIFYSHFNIEDGRKCTMFYLIVLYYFKECKNTTQTQKQNCAMYGEGSVTD